MFFTLVKNIENTKMVYAATSYNRSVYVSPLKRLGVPFAQVVPLRFTPTAHSTHIFASHGNLRCPLSDVQKLHIQPERYARLVYYKKIYRKMT
jgi:hypothetical protein